METLRKGSDSTSTRLLLGIVLLVFMFWGVGSGQQGSNTIIAEVNGTSITRTDVDRAFRQAYNQEVQRRQGRRPEDDEAAQLRTNVIQELIQQEALVQEAERLGVLVHPDEVARYITRISAFKNKDGKFDDELYRERIRGMGSTAAQFEEQIRREILIGRLSEIAAGAVSVTDDEIKTAALLEGTQIELSFVRLSNTAFLEDVVIPDAERDQFIQQNADKIKASYDADYDRFYNLPKRYQLRSILLRTDIPGTDAAALKQRAEAIRAEAAAPGADFAALARRYSEDASYASSGGNLGMRPAAQFDPKETEAADAAGVGKVTGVVETSKGLEILLVEKIEEAKVISLDEARNDIALRLMRGDRVGPVVQNFASGLITAWSQSGQPPQDQLDGHKLTIERTPAFSLADSRIPTIGESAELSAALRSAAAGAVLPQAFTIRDTVFVIAVSNRIEPSELDLPMQLKMTRGRLLMERKQAFVEAWVQAVVARAKVVRGAG